VTERWKGIEAARKLLGLSERASIREVKRAFRERAKELHPDSAGGGDQIAGEAMRELNQAYRLLLDHCESCKIPLTREEADEPLDGEEWWMDRFGQDPLWGPGNKRGKNG